MSRSSLPCFVAIVALSAACQPGIGDSCGGSRDCSPTGERQCDLAQPGGYCTVVGCDPDTCPGGSVCVEWRFNPGRTGETWCMKPCSNDDGCRSNYLCALPSRITQNSERLPEVCPALPENEQIARIIDLESSKARSQVCAALVQGDACGDDPVNGQEPDGGVP